MFSEQDEGNIMKDSNGSTWRIHWRDMIKGTTAASLIPRQDLEQDLQVAAGPWFAIDCDPITELAESLAGVVKVSYQRGPLMRAVVEAAPMDARLELARNKWVTVFDGAVTSRVEKNQAAELVPDLDARAVAIALNRRNVGTLIHHFGHRPRSKLDPVCTSITRSAQFMDGQR